MRRRARPLPFARRRLGSRLRDLTMLPMSDWPRHLRLARAILVDELGADDLAADVLRSSLSAAHGCAQRIDQRAQDAFNRGNRKSLRKVFVRLAKCANRLPASQRRVLDRKVSSSLGQEAIDSESIEGLIEVLITAFGRWPRTEPSLTVLRAVEPRSSTTLLRRAFSEAAILLREDYSTLSALDQREVESALSALSDRKGDKFDTADVCMTISRALEHDRTDEITLAAHDLITDYVAAVADVWKQHGLRPARATHPFNPAHRSKFHRFVDLVLTSVVDPGSKRHDGDQSETLAKLREVHAQIPEADRRIVRAAPRRSDVEWPVSEDHVRKALRAKSEPPNSISLSVLSRPIVPIKRRRCRRHKRSESSRCQFLLTRRPKPWRQPASCRSKRPAGPRLEPHDAVCAAGLRPASVRDRRSAPIGAARGDRGVRRRPSGWLWRSA